MQERRTEAGKEEEEEKEGAKKKGHDGTLFGYLIQPSANRGQLRSGPIVMTLKYKTQSTSDNVLLSLEGQRDSLIGQTEQQEADNTER